MSNDDQKWEAMCLEHTTVNDKRNTFFFDEEKQIAITAPPWEVEYETVERQLADVERRMREFTLQRFGRE